MFSAWPAVIVATAVSLVLTPLLGRWLSSHGLVDQPGLRRSHEVPTPRGGGLAMMVAVVTALAVSPVAVDQWAPPAVFVVGLGWLGWLDDVRDRHPYVRLGIQLGLTGGALWLVGGVAAVAFLGTSLAFPLLWTALAWIAVIWLINLHNFMDGSDGLAAMQGIWSGLVLGGLLLIAGQEAVGTLGLVLAGAMAGFLVWNHPPARIFMGDAGSLVLGGAVAFMALAGAATGTVSIWLSFIVTSVFVVDATATLALRVIRGQQWYTAHRQHAYQRLIAYGWGHGRVLLLYALINGLMVLPTALVAVAYPHLDAVLAGMLALVLSGGWWIVQSATTMENEQHE